MENLSAYSAQNNVQCALKRGRCICDPRPHPCVRIRTELCRVRGPVFVRLCTGICQYPELQLRVERMEALAKNIYSRPFVVAGTCPTTS